MATTLEELQVLITAETSDLRRQLSGVQQHVKQQMGGVEKEVNRASGAIGSVLKKVGIALAGVFAVKKVVDYGKAAVQTYEDIGVKMAKVEQVMRNTMGATDAQIESIKKLTQAQEGIGVVAWDSQMAGAQELGTYLSNVQSLKTLIPAMNDMLAQQYGTNATDEQAVNMATMIGKVMEGQLGALSRYGYSWTAAQEKVLKFGNELERANMLAQVIEESVGGMNAKLAQTPAGQLKQLEFTFAGIREQIGKGLQPVLATVLPYVQKLANWLGTLANYFSSFMQAFFGVSAAQTNVAAAVGGAASAQEAYGNAAETAGNKAKKAAKDAKGALAGFDEINSLTAAAKSGSDVGAGPGGIGPIGDIQIPSIDTNTIPQQVQSMVAKVKGILGSIGDGAKGIGEKLKEAYAGMGPALQPIFNMKEPIMASFKEMGETATRYVNNYLKPMVSYLLLDFIPSIDVAFTKSFAPVFADVGIWAVQEFSRVFKNVTAEAEKLWKGTWLPSLEKVKGAFLESFPVMAGAVQTVLDGTIKPFVDYLLNKFIIPISSKIQQVLVPVLTDVLVWAMKEVAKTFKWAADLMNDIYKTVIEPVFNLIKKIVMDTLQNVQDLWKKHGDTLLKNLSGFLDSIRTILQKLWDNILKPIFEPALKMLTELWDKHLKGLVAQVADFVMKVVNGGLEIWNKFVSPLVSWLLDKLKPTFTSTFDFLAKVVGTLVGGIVDAAKGIFKALGGIVDFITGVFTGNWSKAWNGLKDVVSGVFSGLWSIVKIPLNLIIDGVNKLISGLNKFSFNVPDGVAKLAGMEKGGTFGIHIDPIKRLAKGGITTGATVATIGEAGREAVLPLENNTGWMDKLAEAIAGRMSFIGGGNTSSNRDLTVVLKVDSEELGRASIKGINNVHRISGKLLLDI